MDIIGRKHFKKGRNNLRDLKKYIILWVIKKGAIGNFGELMKQK